MSLHLGSQLSKYYLQSKVIKDLGGSTELGRLKVHVSSRQQQPEQTCPCQTFRQHTQSQQWLISLFHSSHVSKHDVQKLKLEATNRVYAQIKAVKCHPLFLITSQIISIVLSCITATNVVFLFICFNFLLHIHGQ